MRQGKKSGKREEPGDIPDSFPEPSLDVSTGVNLPEQLAHGGFQLLVATAEHLVVVVADFDIGLQLGVLEVVALRGAVAHDGNAEVEGRVLEGFPIDGGHGAGNGHADQRTELFVAVHPGGAVGVGVVRLADEHDGGLVVAAGGHLARHDAANHLFQVFLAAEEDFDVLVEASPAVVAGIDDDALLEVVFTEDVGVDVAVALVVHAGDVDVAEAPAGETFHFGGAALDPAFVEEGGLRGGGEGLHDLFPTLTGTGVVEGEEDGGVRLAVDEGIIVLARQDGLTVEFLDDDAGFHAGGAVVEEAVLQDFLDAQPVAFVLPVEEQPEFGGGLVGARRAIAGTGVGDVQFAEYLAEEFGEVMVVVDVGEEGAVCLPERREVHAVIVGAVEALRLLGEDVVEHVFALCRLVQLHFQSEREGRDLVAWERHPGGLATEDIEGLAVFGKLQGRSGNIQFFDHADCAAAGVLFPKVVVPLEGGEEVEGLPVPGEGGGGDAGGHGREADDPLGEAVEVDGDGWLGSGAFLVFIAGSRLFGFLCLFLFGFQEVQFLFGEQEAVHGLAVHEGDVNVFLAAPGGVGTHAEAVGDEEDGVAAHHPSRRHVEIGAVGDVVYPASLLGGDDADIAVGVAAVGDEGKGEPVAVGRPLVGEASSTGAVVLRAVGNLPHGAALEIQHFEEGAPFNEGELRAVGGESGGGPFHGVAEERSLLDEGRVGKVHVFGTGFGRLIKAPDAGAAAGVNDGLPVGRDGDALLGFGGAGNLLGGAILGGDCE